MSHLKELDYLKIPFDHIKLATDNFAQHNFLGQGGFGRVYKGRLPPTDHSTTNILDGTTVAVKRLDVNRGQGDQEFFMEIVMLASYKHDNLVTLVGFTDEGNEKILVYKNEENGSLDKHLASIDLTWDQRLRICLGAARGLEYLHGGVGMEHRVLHRDVKSSNILLDANWEAKISDFGLSKVGPRNQQYTFLVTGACGTPGYVDPLYANTGVLTKESDVYSFGVVLFEVLCGRLAMLVKYEDERRLLSRLVKSSYRNGKLGEIIFPSLVEQMNPDSLELFSKIAFKCLHEDQKLRPSITSVVVELESALEHQLGALTKLWGSKTGGDPFFFRIESNQKLRMITVYYDIWIHSLLFMTEDSDGIWHYKDYGTVPYSMYGRMSNNVEKLEINLDAGEEIIGLSGSIGVYNGHELVTSLSFKTSKRKKYATFNHEADNRFSGSWDKGLFDGFYGRKGMYIDAIGCCLKANALVD